MASFPYKKVLLIGATSGIGLELAEQLVLKGVYVISVGRRQNRLDSFISAHGSSKAAGFAFDIAEIDKIPSFAET